MYTLHHGDCLEIMPTIPTASVDAVITDPPYPMIKRDYGMLTEAEWWDLMMGVVKETRRVLKPTGSAVFILQPNSRKVGSMRGWLWRFMWWITEEWNMVQDVWWWNVSALPTGVSTPIERGLLRASVKACIWSGNEKCYRNQSNVLWDESQDNATKRLTARMGRVEHPSGQGINAYNATRTSIERGGVTPFNLLPVPNTNSVSSSAAYGHGAGTPLKLADWWTRYIVPQGGVVLDPFCGAGTMGIAALQNGASFIGIEKMESYADISRRRIADSVHGQTLPLLGMAAD